MYERREYISMNGSMDDRKRAIGKVGRQTIPSRCYGNDTLWAKIIFAIWMHNRSFSFAKTDQYRSPNSPHIVCNIMSVKCRRRQKRSLYWPDEEAQVHCFNAGVPVPKASGHSVLYRLLTNFVNMFGPSHSTTGEIISPVSNRKTDFSAATKNCIGFA